MIFRISDIKTQTAALSKINKDFIKARQIQAQLQKGSAHEALPDQGQLSTPMTGESYPVRVTRWIE